MNLLAKLHKLLRRSLIFTERIMKDGHKRLSEGSWREVLISSLMLMTIEYTNALNNLTRRKMAFLKRVNLWNL